MEHDVPLTKNKEWKMVFVVIEGWQGLDLFDMSERPVVFEKEEDAQKYCNELDESKENDGKTRGYYEVHVT